MKEMSEYQYIDNIINIFKEKLEKDYKCGQTKRDAHPKSLGLLKAKFIVNSNLPKALRVGIFKDSKTYPAIIRISNSNPKVQGDNKKDIRGFAIKLLDAPGKKLIDDEKNTQDFLLVSTKTLPLGTVKLFHDAVYYNFKVNPLVFLCKMISSGNLNKLKDIALSRKHDTSPLDISYYSTTPYMFGQEIVKYCIIPTSKYKSKLPSKLSYSYLSDNMQQHLRESEATFDFMIQIKKHNMPVEDASVKWCDKKSPYIKVGEIVIDKQEFINKKRAILAENLSFSPAHCLVDHKPIGGINRARIKIYKEMSTFRHKRNNIHLVEPTIEDYNSL
ncbi:hypothetical protein [Romboutsia sp.]|uniref:hypothetical protein n=1 Tax=Romboutsia sp. TaxID=1965302 RepID=UPI003F2D6DF9